MSALDGMAVAITGASSGIGAATARELAQRGAGVLLGARRAERLEQLAADIEAAGGRAVVCPVDVTRRDDVERFVATAVQELGALDVLVANAGVATVEPMAGLDVERWEAMIDVNLRGVMYGIAAALPRFQAQGHGHFVTTISTSGLRIAPGQAVYAATKNAVRTMLEALRQESTDGAIRTTGISPGYVRTELVPGLEDTFAIDPGAVARAIAFAVEQPADVEIGDIVIRPTLQG